MYLSLLVCFCTYYSPEIDYETKKKKKLRNDSYIFFFLLVPKYIYSCAVHAARFFPVQKHTHFDFFLYVSSFFSQRFLFCSCFLFLYLLRSIIKTKLQICILLFECFVFHRLKQTYK
jgi:hypothetical protein